MSLVNQTFLSRFKDLLVINNSNSGFDTNIDQITSGNGNGSSLYLSTNNLKVQPTADSTTNSVIYDKDGNILFQVDSTNDTVKALGNHVNIQYAYFGITSVGSSGYAANTHYPVFFNFASGSNLVTDVDFGTGTDPNDSFTTADTDTQYASQIVPMMWRAPDNISIDSVTHIEGADAATGDSATRMHLKSFDFTSGSTSCLANGTLLANSSDVSNSGNEQAYLSTWTIDSASVTAGKVILCFFRSDSVNSDYSLNVTVKYHLT